MRTFGARSILLAAGAIAGLTSVVTAQAPASAQVWDVRFVVDTTGPNRIPTASDRGAGTAIGITMFARVSILANTSASGTANLGVSRVGGNNAVFFMSVADGNAGGIGTRDMTVGATGEAGNDSLGNPLAGHFRPFRGSFAPAGSGGDNANLSNGRQTDVSGSPALTSVVGSRAFGYNGVPLGVATGNTPASLVGDYVAVFRFLYIPAFYNRASNAALGTFPSVTLSVTGMSARYLYQDNGAGTATAAAQVNLPNQTVTFQVPTPGAAALVGLGGLLAARRRRA